MTLTQLRTAIRTIAADPELARNAADLWGQLASGELSPDEAAMSESVLVDQIWSFRDGLPPAATEVSNSP